MHTFCEVGQLNWIGPLSVDNPGVAVRQWQSRPSSRCYFNGPLLHSAYTPFKVLFFVKNIGQWHAKSGPKAAHGNFAMRKKKSGSLKKKWERTGRNASHFAHTHTHSAKLVVRIKQHVKFEIATYAKKSPIQLFEQFPARIYWTTCFICLHWQLLSGTPCTMKLLSISHVTWLHYFHYIVLRVLILYTMYVSSLSSWYCLSSWYYVVYPADTILFIQLILCCISSWYYCNCYLFLHNALYLW